MRPHFSPVWAPVTRDRVRWFVANSAWRKHRAFFGPATRAERATARLLVESPPRSVSTRSRERPDRETRLADRVGRPAGRPTAPASVGRARRASARVFCTATSSWVSVRLSRSSPARAARWDGANSAVSRPVWRARRRAGRAISMPRGPQGSWARQDLAQLVEQRLGGAVEGQRRVGREQNRAHDGGAAADQSVEDATGRQGQGRRAAARRAPAPIPAPV
jgi:hypothetical protein